MNASQDLEAVLKNLPPREVPSELFKKARSPVATFLSLLGFMEFLLGWFLLVFLLILSRGKEASAELPPVWPIPVAIILAALVMMLWARQAQQKTRQILSRGQQLSARVLKVKSMGARINARTFFRVIAQIPSQNDALVKGTISNYSLEYYLDARDNQKDVQVLYTPEVSDRILLLHELTAGNRLD